MRKILFILVLICAAAFFAGAQQPTAPQRPAPQASPATSPRITSAIATMGVPLPLPPAAEVDIRDQPDSPIHLSIDDTFKGRMPSTPLKVRNDSSSTVAAYVLRVDVEPYGYNQMVILGQKGLAVSDARVQGLAPWNNRDGTTSKHFVSVDYVQFTDGKSWGEDSVGKSKDITAYLKGRNDALARLQEMMAGQDATDINKALDLYGSSSFAEPNLPTGRPPRYIDYAQRGLEEVINILRRMPRNTELGRDLANRLEAATKRPDQ
jgi:hypothetical protein